MKILEITDYKSLAILDYVKQLSLHFGKQSKVKIVPWENSFGKRADIYHYHYSNSTYKVILPLCFSSKQQTVVTLHDIIPRSNRFRKYIAPLFYRIINFKARTIIVHSQHARELVNNYFPFINKKKVVVIPYGCIPAVINQQETERLQKELGATGNIRLFLYLGSLKKSKGIIETIEAFTKVKSEDARLYFIGRINDEAVGQAFKSLTDTRIRHLGALPDDEVQKWLQCAHALVNFRLDSVGETSASVITMLNFGKPVLATDIGSNKEIIHTAGILCGKEVKQIQQTFETYLKDTNYQKTLEEKASKRFRSYTCKRIYNRKSGI